MESDSNWKTINFNKTMLKRFKKTYNACDTECFMFEGNEYLKTYAKYVIEYLEGKFKEIDAHVQ